MNAARDSINRTKIDIKLEKVADEKPLTLELGATYAMLREYVCYNEDFDSCDILAAMPVGIDSRNGVVNNIYFYVVAFDAYRLKINAYTNGHVVALHEDKDNGEFLSIEVPAHELFQIISTMPKRGNQRVNFGPLTIEVFNLITPISIKDIKYAKIYPLQNKIIDLRQWPRDALFGWATIHLKLDDSQIQIARDMDQKYKIIEYCQEMFTHQCSKFNKTAAKKIKEGFREHGKPFEHLGFTKEREYYKLPKDFGMCTYAIDHEQPTAPYDHPIEEETNYNIVTLAKGYRRISKPPPGRMTEINDIDFTSEKMVGHSAISYTHRDEYRISIEKTVRQQGEHIELGLMAFLIPFSTGTLHRMELVCETINNLFLEADDICLINLNRGVILRIKNKVIEPDKLEVLLSLKAITENIGNIPLARQVPGQRPIGSPIGASTERKRLGKIAKAPHDGMRHFIDTDFLTVPNMNDLLPPYLSLSWMYISSEGVRCKVEVEKRTSSIGKGNIEIASFLTIEDGPKHRMLVNHEILSDPFVMENDLCAIVLNGVLVFHIKKEEHSQLQPWHILNVPQIKSEISHIVQYMPEPELPLPMPEVTHKEFALDILARNPLEAHFDNTSFLSGDERSPSELNYSDRLLGGDNCSVIVKKKIDGLVQHVIWLAAYVEIEYSHRHDENVKSTIQYRMDVGYEAGVVPSNARKGDVFVIVIDSTFTLHIRKPLLNKNDNWLALNLDSIKRVTDVAQKRIEAQENIAKQAEADKLIKAANKIIL